MFCRYCNKQCFKMLNGVKIKYLSHKCCYTLTPVVIVLFCLLLNRFMLSHATILAILLMHFKNSDNKTMTVRQMLQSICYYLLYRRPPMCPSKTGLTLLLKLGIHGPKIISDISWSVKRAC